MSDLKDEFQTVEGVGPATADKILDVLDAHDTGATDPLLERAKAAAAEGNDRDAAVYLRRMGDN